ncbi:WXG100 family type VII secretion target [Nocardioides daeguensis]|uniref:WXG100 family type VII secretion target n=1 Tax=Nocardioides daeguensis TaxID=908359 RepID=A0ABP6UTC2_9ACTN|nr:WXG100 family type VII secretion target [Nocardioides daeguensis]MBV6728700.1 WXG100 family type VII secretion target [Nocardioides daeguensis]MCR1773691.1 WXG100 family type VII secretion target [Nocardioides daeguensis]
MAGTEFGHGEGALKKVAELVAATKQDLVKQSQTMEAQLEDMRNHWVGGGGLAFKNVKEAWIEKHKVVTSALDKFEASLIETESDNVNTDSQASGDLAGFLSKLDAQS